MDHRGSGMNVKSYDLCLVVDLDGVGQAGYWATGWYSSAIKRSFETPPLAAGFPIKTFRSA